MTIWELLKGVLGTTLAYLNHLLGIPTKVRRIIIRQYGVPTNLFSIHPLIKKKLLHGRTVFFFAHCHYSALRIDVLSWPFMKKVKAEEEKIYFQMSHYFLYRHIAWYCPWIFTAIATTVLRSSQSVSRLKFRKSHVLLQNWLHCAGLKKTCQLSLGDEFRRRRGKCASDRWIGSAKKSWASLAKPERPKDSFAYFLGRSSRFSSEARGCIIVAVRICTINYLTAATIDQHSN